MLQPLAHLHPASASSGSSRGAFVPAHLRGLLRDASRCTRHLASSRHVTSHHHGSTLTPPLVGPLQPHSWLPPTVSSVTPSSISARLPRMIFQALTNDGACDKGAGAGAAAGVDREGEATRGVVGSAHQSVGERWRQVGSKACAPTGVERAVFGREARSRVAAFGVARGLNKSASVSFELSWE